MEVSNYLKKFTLLLDYVFEGKVVLNESNTEKLLKFLEDKTDNSPGKTLLDTPGFSDLILNSIKHNIPNATTSVKIFLIEVITILFKNELQFNKMQAQGFQCSSIGYAILAKLGPNTINLRLKLACTKLATVQISHCSGLKLILEHKIWKYILYPDIHTKSIEIAKAAYKFISLLVRRVNEYNKEAELIEIMSYVVSPITTSEYLKLKEIDIEKDGALSEKIKTHLNALMVILDDVKNETVNPVMNLLRTYFLIEPAIFAILGITRFTSMINILNDIAFLFHYTSYRNKMFTDKSDEFCNELVAFYHNCIVQNIKKRDLGAVLDCSVKNIMFWSNFEKTYKDTVTLPLTFSRNGQTFVFTNQLIVHLTEPLVVYTFYNQFSMTETTLDQFIEEYCLKLVKTMTDHILSSCYLFKSLLETSDLKQAAIETVRQLFRLKGYLSPSQAGIVFQSLYHVLNVFILSDGKGGLILNENPIKCPDDVKLLSLVLDAIQMLLKEHNISWYENVEIVCLQEGLMNLLKQNILNIKQLVKVLDLIDICVKKFLSPNMSLLVESRQDSTLTEIGAVMKMYMHHDDWEVRDSALNLLHSCTDISFIKYIPLQKVICENNLMIFAANMALNDPEYYVQSTGLKCLAAATKIEGIWRDVVINNPHIYRQLFYLLRNHPEGLVRKETTKVLTMVYINQKVTTSFKTNLYEQMMAAALDDLHWEVQLAALQFWKHAIKNHLSYRGMIDGKFPSVTFSKEKRKIITLDSKEIIRQLTSIMQDLSSIGCLTVLLESMNEVYNIEIMEQAHSMAMKLIEILEIYKFNKIIDDKTTYPAEGKLKDREEDMAVDLTYSTINEELRNNVIDSILRMDQSELIMNLHDNSCQKKTDDMDEEFRCYVSRKKLVQPNKFISTFKETDYQTIIKHKKNWNADVYSSLDVLLDEILDI